MKSKPTLLVLALGFASLFIACDDDGGSEETPPANNAGAPVIESVNGDGTASAADGAAPNRIASSLDVTGQNLSGAEVSLAGIGSSVVFESLAVAASSSANRLLVSLPAALTQGNYTLTLQ
ncbi:MAG: hypothetical protein AAF735_02745 [Myxococcota bacterium]